MMGKPALVPVIPKLVRVKVITTLGTERIIRYAFAFAQANERKKVTCMTKDNILKLTDGYFHRTFLEIAKEYPSLQCEHHIIDIGAAKLAAHPEDFDVIVAPNLYGDILSDIAAEVSGSIAFAGSINIAENFALFEAVHGTAPDIAGKGIADPSGLLLAAIYMLIYLGCKKEAHLIHDAWLLAKEDKQQKSAQEIITRLGKRPKEGKKLVQELKMSIQTPSSPFLKQEQKGFDLYVRHEGPPQIIPKPDLITNRGNTHYHTVPCIDEWCLRYYTQDKLIDFLQAFPLTPHRIETLFSNQGK